MKNNSIFYTATATATDLVNMEQDAMLPS